MAFFLLGRSEDGTLSLLSDQAFDSRQDAVAELGTLTAAPEFDRWTDDVRVIEFEVGTQVLLVRPTSAPLPDEQSEAADSEPEAGEFAALADEETEAQDVPNEDELPPTGAVLDDTVSEPEGVDAASVEAAAAESVPSDASPAQTSEPESPDVEGDALGEAEPVDGEEESAETAPSLRDAIARTTEHMEATGIVAPESIGPAPTVEPQVEAPATDIEESTGDGASEPAEIESGEATEPEIADESAAVSEPAAPQWPWATPAEQQTDVTSAEIDVAFVLEGLEEPAIDEGGSLIASTIDDESLAASRPVILGSYDEGAGADADSGGSEPKSAGGDMTEDLDSIEPEDASDFIVLDDIEADSETEQATSTADEPAEVGQPSTETAPAPADPGDDDVLSLSAYVCTDCVYVDTCPNKDQRRPEDCGSFQWK